MSNMLLRKVAPGNPEEGANIEVQVERLELDNVADPDVESTGTRKIVDSDVLAEPKLSDSESAGSPPVSSSRSVSVSSSSNRSRHKNSGRNKKAKGRGHKVSVLGNSFRDKSGMVANQIAREVVAVQEEVRNHTIKQEELDKLKAQVDSINKSLSLEVGKTKPYRPVPVILDDPWLLDVNELRIKWGNVPNYWKIGFGLACTAFSIYSSISSSKFDVRNLGLLVPAAAALYPSVNCSHYIEFVENDPYLPDSDERSEEKRYADVKYNPEYAWFKHTLYDGIKQTSKMLRVSLELLSHICSKARNLRPDVDNKTAWEKIFNYADSFANVNINRFSVLNKENVVLDTSYVAFGLYMHFRERHDKLKIVPLN